MSRALLTFGIGSHAELLNLALPSFEAYAARHGYELIVAHPDDGDRPPSWLKVPALIEALGAFDEVLWLDADVLVLRYDVDVTAGVPACAWQAMVRHHTPDGEVPNHGVWLARRALVPVLERIWRMDAYVHHPWWEQAAGCQLLGYDPSRRPMSRQRDTELFAHTHWLGLEWNSHRDDEHPDPRFWHASVRGRDLCELMRDQLRRACGELHLQ